MFDLGLGGGRYVDVSQASYRILEFLSTSHQRRIEFQIVKESHGTGIHEV